MTEHVAWATDHSGLPLKTEIASRLSRTRTWSRVSATHVSWRSAKQYFLKGLIYCAYCKMPMWAQTYRNCNRYYREQHGSREAGNCVNTSGEF